MVALGGFPMADPYGFHQPIVVHGPSWYHARSSSRPVSSSDGFEGGSRTMFHGTSESNAASIERGGFNVSSDGMLGRGVYLSKDFSKASAYGSVVLEV